MIINTEEKTISQALADGTLIDVTETAESLGFELPAFMTPALWKNRFKESKAEMGYAIQRLVSLYAVVGLDHFGPTDWKDEVTATIDYDEERGRVMLLTEYRQEHTLDVKRVSGELVERVM